MQEVIDIGQQRSLGELFSDLTRETGELVKKEVSLAKAEMTAKAAHAARDGILLGVGAGIAGAGVLALFAGLILALGTLVPLWLAAFLVGAVFCAVGAVVALVGLKELKKIDPKPRLTIRSLEENKQWISEQMSR